MSYMCENADKVFFLSMAIILLIFIASQVVICIKLGGVGGELPEPPKKSKRR